MTIQNPDYMPDWQNYYDGQKSLVDGKEQKIKVLNQSMEELKFEDRFEEWDTLDDQRAKLVSEVENHKIECQNSISLYQHKTIRDFALWQLEKAAWGMHYVTNDNIFDYVDVNSFSTVSEVLDMIGLIYERELSCPETLLSKREEKPFRGKLTDSIFSLGKNNSICVTDLNVTAGEITFSDLRLIIDKRESVYNVCLYEYGVGQKKINQNTVAKNYEVIAHKVSERLLSNEGEGNSNINFYLLGDFGSRHGRFVKADMKKGIGGYYDLYWRGQDEIPDIISSNIPGIYKSETDFLTALESDRKKKKRVEGHPKQQQKRYNELASDLNGAEVDYTNNVSSILDDFLYLYKQKGAAIDHLRQYSLIRDIVSEFENYVLRTAKAYINVLNTDRASEGFKKKLRREQLRGGDKNIYHRDLIKRQFKGACGKETRIGKFLELFRQIGYPIEEFEKIKENYLSNLNKIDFFEDSVFRKECDYELRGARQKKREYERRFDYIKTLEELMILRNLIEHENGHINANKKPMLEQFGQNGERITITNYHIMRFINATLIFMNHIKRAIDFDTADKKLSRTCRDDIPASSELLSELKQTFDAASDFDPVLSSSIQMSYVLSEGEMHSLVTDQNSYEAFSYGLEMLQNWRTQQVECCGPHFTPYIPNRVMDTSYVKPRKFNKL